MSLLLLLKKNYAAEAIDDPCCKYMIIYILVYMINIYFI